MKKLFGVLTALCAAGLAGTVGAAYAYPVRAEEPAPSEHVYVLDDCDTTKNFTESCTSTNKHNFVQGTGCLSKNGPVPTLVGFFNDLDYDLFPAWEQAYLEFYLYISDASEISSEGQLELTSFPDFDTNEINYAFTKTNVVTGWQHVSIKLSEMGTTGGKFDYKRLNGLRLYCNFKSEQNVGLDYLILTDTPHTIAPEDIAAKKENHEKLPVIESETNTYTESKGCASAIGAGSAMAGLGVLAAAGILLRAKKHRKEGNHVEN